MASQEEQFTHAVMCSFDVTAEPLMRSQANASLEALRQAEEGWSFCLQMFASAHEEHVKFWCLQTVTDMVVRQRRYESLPEERKQQMRTALLTWLQQKGQPQTDEPASIKNKFAQLLVAVLRHDYPTHWPDAFSQLLGTLHSGPVSIDLFLRVLNAVHEEVVVNEEGNGYDSSVAGRVKDGMRERCLPQLAEAWLTILRLHESAPALSVACLGTVESYVSWIPIGLVANGPWLQLLQSFLRSKSEALHEGACAVLGEIVVKRMEAPSKMEHLTNLGIVPMLSESLSTQSVAVTSKFAALVSALSLELLECWDRLAGGLPSAPNAALLGARATEMLSQTFPLLLACFASDDMETSQGTLSFLHSYIGRLRKLLPSPKEISSHEGHLQHLLMVMGSKSVHPAEYNFDEPDDEEEQFSAYRRELSTLVKGVARVHPTLTQDFVQRTLRSTLEAIESVPWTHLEVALWLLYTLGEGLPDSLVREKGGYFEQLMEALLSSRASSYPHRSVQLLFFEICVRYSRFFLANPSYLSGTLSTFLGGAGLYNPQAKVRERTCYLLLRFVKQTIKSAKPEFFEVVGTLRDLLSTQHCERDYYGLLAQLCHEHGIPPPSPTHTLHQANGHGHAHATGGFGGSSSPQNPQVPTLTDAEQIHVFETCGCLLGGHLAPAESVGEQLRLLLDRPIANLQQLCTHTASCGGVAAVGAASWPGVGSAAAGATHNALSQLVAVGRGEQLATARASEAAFQISAIAHVSKGFGELVADGSSASLRESFSRATQVCLAAMGSFGDAPEVRSRALMLLRRMVEMQGDDLLSYLDAALPQLLTRADAHELVELVTLVNQLVLKFRSKVMQPVTQLFGALAGATFSQLAALDAQIASSSSASIGSAAPASDDVRERRALLRCFYSLVHSLVHSDLVGVLAAPANASHTEPSLKLLLIGCVEGPDMTLQRQCFSILQRLVELWVGSIPGFDGYVLRDVLPVCFSAIAQPHFNLKDAAALPLLESSAALQKAMLQKLGAEVLAGYLRDQLLPSLGCSAELASEYVRNLCEGDVRTLREFIRTQLLRGRQ